MELQPYLDTYPQTVLKEIPRLLNIKKFIVILSADWKILNKLGCTKHTADKQEALRVLTSFGFPFWRNQEYYGKTVAISQLISWNYKPFLAYLRSFPLLQNCWFHFQTVFWPIARLFCKFFQSTSMLVNFWTKSSRVLERSGINKNSWDGNHNRNTYTVL